MYGLHPQFNFSEAVGQSGMSCCGDGFDGDIELDVIGIAEQVEPMMVYNVNKWEHVDDEQDRTKH